MSALEIDFTRKHPVYLPIHRLHSKQETAMRTPGALNNGNWFIHDTRGLRKTQLIQLLSVNSGISSENIPPVDLNTLQPPGGSGFVDRAAACRECSTRR